MDENRIFLFVFDRPENARVFVSRIVLNLKHVAMYVDGIYVHVVDGNDTLQGAEIRRLARMSGASPSAPFRAAHSTRP